MDKNEKQIVLSLIGVITILIIGAFLYKLYVRFEGFVIASQNIAQLSILDTNAKGNAILTNNDYVGVMSDAYNKLVMQDENAINEIYKDVIQKSAVIGQLSGQNKQNANNKLNKFPVDGTIKTIKSKNNAQMLSLMSNDASGKYGVMVNDNCLTVSGMCGADSPYCVQPCQNSIYLSDSQKFTVTNIATSADAKKIMGSSANISSKNVYPFNIVRSNVDNTCLAMSNDGLTMEQCNLNDIRQQWSISPDENICLLN